MQGNLNALGLMAALLLTAIVLRRFGDINRKRFVLLAVFVVSMTLPINPLVILILNSLVLWRFGNIKSKQILLALLGSLIAVIVISIGVFYKCGAENNPSLQVSLPVFCILLILLFVDRKKIAYSASLILFLLGLALSRHFHYLIFTAGSYSGSANSFSCADIKPTGKEITIKKWHTSFTGLYKVER